ncbi:hypothetical protein LR48_Vigan11g139400 [Vigna angularis]|uniref:Putative plant transposon protein domain-containing protein n=1 Tax=Phaseolus angularis TaxID=3914 RepID=A0A0L9VTF7_PHAAN|nr:hypothetical protein LR48_Vigan11g139400 [Vigna angularis]
MASASGSKRIKTTTANTKKGHTGKKKMSQPTFLSKKHQKNFEASQNRRLLMERVVEQLPLEEPQFVEEGQPINVGHIIAHEINDCAHTQLTNTPLGHPSLITHLCELAGVYTSNPPFERSRKTIDRSYYLQYCFIDEEGQHIPTSQPPRPHRSNRPDPPAQPDEPGPQDPYQMYKMRMALIDAKLEAINWMGLAHADMMRHVYASSHQGFMTPEEYAARVAWPGDQTQYNGGGGRRR